MFPNCPGAKGDQGVQHSNHYISDLDPEISELAMALRRKQQDWLVSPARLARSSVSWKLQSQDYEHAVQFLSLVGSPNK